MPLLVSPAALIVTDEMVQVPILGLVLDIVSVYKFCVLDTKVVVSVVCATVEGIAIITLEGVVAVTVATPLTVNAIK